MGRGRKRQHSYVVRMVADAVPVGEAGQNRGQGVAVTRNKRKMIDSTATGGVAAAAPTCQEIKKARATPLRVAPLLLLVADALRPHLASASTSLPSSSELCPDETAACYESALCWDCVAQFEDSSEYCEDRFPVLAAEDDDGCEAASALYCCSFDASGQDCLDDTVTVDYFRCGVLEGSGCDLSDSPCGGSSSSTTSPDDDVVTATSLSPDDDDESPTSADDDESADDDAWADDGDAWADDDDAWANDDDPWADDDDDSSPSDDDHGSQSADEENDDLGPDSDDNSGAVGTFAAPSRSSSAASLWGALYCIVLVVWDALTRV